ncbi:twitchin-like isoform X2 [Oppia nitens]|uniref:twitchin-like isoform X2 n=1 Tax=Oppia nitens TaxID=1686743 RepID=UPI0023DA149E|nr:twitchin-like isoform X2 [Oppia nitens]
MVKREESPPTFIIKPKIQEEDDGNRLVFECQLISNPRPEIQWLQNEFPVIEDYRVFSKIKEFEPNKYIVQLEVNDVVETDAGTYKVVAKNKSGEVFATINLNFTPANEPHETQVDGIAPTFEKKPSIRQEDDGRLLYFECFIIAEPKPEVTWTHNGSHIVQKGRFKTTLEKKGKGYHSVMQINEVNVEDAGKYKVIAKNELGESNAAITLNFDDDEAPPPIDGAKPTFTEKPVIKKSDDCSRITFECRLVADPNPTIQWYLNNKIVKEDSRHKFSLLSDKHNQLASLSITDVANGDGGIYKVVAINKHGEGYATINLNIDEGKLDVPDGKAPRFPKKPTIRQKGTTLILECLLESNPFPEITWYYGTRIITSTSRYSIKKMNSGKDTYILSLEISDPTIDDGGNYRCNAVNQLGESNANIALNFQSNNMEEEEEEEELHSKTKRTKKEKTTFEETNETRVEQTEVEETKTKKDSLMKNAENKESMAIKKTREEMAEEKSVIIESSKEMDEKIAIKEESIKKSVDIKKSAEEMNKESVAVKKSTKEEESIAVKNIVEDKQKQSIIKKDVTEEKRKDSIVIEEPKKKLSLKKSREKTPQPTDTGAKQTTKEVKENEMEIKKTTIIDDKRKDSITIEEPKKRLSIKKSRENTPTPADNGVKQIQKDDQRKDSITVEEPKKRLSIKKSRENTPTPTDNGVKQLQKDEQRKDSLTIEEPKRRLSIKKREKTPTIEEPPPDAARKPSIVGIKEKPKESVTKNETNEEKRKDSLVIEEPKKKLSIKKSVKRESIPKVEEPPAVTGATQPAPGAGPKKDEKGLAVDESGQTKKLRPGEMLEVRRGSAVLRKGSIDLRRSSATEVDVADKPSSALKTSGDEGPPVITDFIGSVSAVDGKTATLQATVESNPVCSFKFFKEGTEIFEGGRYKVVTDGDTNNIYFCIRKAKPNDEGKYTITAINKFGEDSCNIKLFVSDDSGMDFRAMLKAKQYAKWKQEQDNPDWGNLKATEDERRASLKETKKPDVFIKPLQDQHVKEGRDKMVRFEAVYSKSGIKAKWFKGRTELFMGKKYNMNSTGDLHVLEIREPRVDDAGQYKVQCLETSCTAMLEVDKPDPVYKFIKPLQKKYEEFTGRELVMECTTNHYKAPVKWYKDESRLESSDRYLIEQDTFGKKILRITSCAVNDSGHYSCRIERTEEITKTEITCTDKQYVFVKPLKSLRTTENETITLECEVDDMYAKVQWFKDGVELKAIPKKLEIISDGRKRKVIIKKAKVTDEGEYTCTTNSDKTICETIVEPANKFRKKLQDKTVLEREDLVLEVEMLEKKAPIKWYKNGQEVKPDDRISFKFNEDGKQQLVITNAQMDDIGEYSVVSDKGIKCSCNVEVKEAEKKPELRLTQTDYQADANRPFSIEIPYKVQGTRTSNVLPKLMRNGEPVSTKDVDIVIKEDKIIITFKKPTRESSGPYDFSLGNSQGESKTPLKFNFVDVPSPPEGPLDVTDVFRDRCKLAWNPTKDTGGLPLLHYVVERQDLSMRGGWVEVGTTPDCNMDVTDLAHKKEYKFRVRAVNKKGASEPLTAPKTYLAKDPYDEPSKPKDVEIVDWDRDHVDLKWKAPEKDGGAPIEKYIVESKDKFSADWVTALEVSGNQLEGKVVPPAIKEGQQYQFRVRAINKAGPSEPSDPTKNLIVKARFVKPFIIGDDLKNLVVKKGAIIKYDIQYGGEPAPEVKWAINGVDIKQSSRISIENTPKNTLLLIKQAVRADSGKFTLTLTNGSGTISKCADVVVLDKPTPPEGPLVVEEVFAESAKLKWKQPKDLGGSELKGYQIEKMDVDSGRWVPVGEVGPNANSFKCEGLTKGKKYKFRVKAINKEGESEPLETDEPIVAKNPYEEPSKPGKPEVVDYDNTKVDLKWTAPEKDGGRPVECYIVEMKDKFSNDWKEVLRTPDAKPEVSVKGLKENSSVQFRVKAVNIAGPGEPSEATEPHVVKHRNQKPYIDRTNLKNITIKAGRSHKYDVDIRGEPPPTVVWTFSDDGIKLSDDLNIKIENIDYHSELTVSKATRKQSGKYKITATNRNGSDSVEVELTVLAAPSRPEGPLEVTDVHKEGCKLKWKKPKDDGGCPVKTYEVEKFDKETGRWTRCGKTDKPEIDVTGLTPGKEYLFRVTAVNEEGDSEPLITLESIIAKNPYDEPTKPGTPEIVDYDNTSVELKWSPPKSDGGANIEKYIIEKKDKNAHNWEKAAEVIGNVCEAKVEDLKERSEVQFRVVAINKAGPSEPSDATKMHCVKHRRLKPYIDRTNLEMITIKRGKQVKLDVNVRGEPPPAITWKLIDNEVKSDDNYDIVNVDYNTKFTLNDCQRKHSGKYKIIAVNEVGKDEAEVEICVLSAPTRPKGPLKVDNVTAKGCDLHWQKPEDDGGRPIQGYVIEKLDPLTGNWVPCGRTDKDKTDFQVTGLQAGKFYQFRVKAINSEGESEPLSSTEPILAKNPYESANAPSKPDIVDWDEKHVDLVWKPPKNDGGAPITGYIVEVKEKFSNNWEPVVETKSSKPEACVAGLIKGKEYQFRIKAVNKAGAGEPSEPTNTHICKERHLKPTINRENLQPITIRAGNMAKLDVEVSGEPPPKIEWFFAGKPLEADNNTRIDNPDYESHIQMRNMTRKQNGKYKIVASNESGKDEAEVEINVLDIPSKPEGPLDVSDVHANGCTLEWNPPKDDGGVPLEGYVVEKKDISSGRWVPVAKVPPGQTSTEVTGLDTGKKYEFRVKAVNPEGESEPLDTDRTILAKNPFDEPGPPGLPVIDNYDKDFVELKWEAPIRDGGAPITGYIIEKKDKYSHDFVPAAEIQGNVCKGKVMGLTEGDKYQFRVRAVNKAGPGVPSDATQPHLAKPRNLVPRIDRTNLIPITVKSGQMVSFDVNVTGEPPPKITWKHKDSELASGETYTIDNIDYNTKFNLMRATRKETGIYTIIAENDSGRDEATVEINILGKPSKPNGPLEVSDVHKEGCKLKWKPPDDDGGTPIECYEVEKMDEETGRWVPCGKAKDCQMQVSNLVPGRKYKFRVRAVNKEGDSDELETDHSTVAKNPFDEPSKPGRPEPTDWDKDHVDLQWTPPESDGGAPIEGYIVEKRKKGTHKWHKAKQTHTPDTKVTVPDLEEGEEYEFRVIAVNKAGPSEPSETSRSVIAKPRRLAPIIDRTNLKPVIIRSGQPVKFDVDVKGEPAPTIQWTFNGEPLKTDDTHSIETEPNHTLFMLSKSKRKDTGSYTITAKNDYGTDEAVVDVKVLSKPSKPKGPLDVSDVHAEGCHLKWDKPEDDGGEPITAYVIEKMDTDTGRWVPVTTTREPEADITGLIPGKEYKFRVKAVNSEGDSEPLETDLAVIAKNPFDEPGKPGKPNVKDWDKHHVDLTWNAPDSDGGAPITSYIIEKKDKFSTKWQKAAEVIGDKCEARVADLIEGMDYQFRVRAVNKAGPGPHSDSSDSVTTKPRNLKPKIDNIRDITVHAGQPIKFDVKVIGEPPPKTLWFVNDSPIKTDGHFAVDNEPYKTKLAVNQSERKDTGVYKLTAENSNGRDEVEVRVTVLDVPSTPEGPLEVTDVHAEGCKLKWKEPKDDGGVPIEAYIIEKQDTQTGRWVPVTTTTRPEAVVNNLEPGKEYKFRVKALNAEGESLPLETDIGIVAKNPYDTPGTPGTPEMTNYDKDHVDLKWDKPMKDGGAPISGYIIEMKEKDGTRWVKGAVIDGDVTSGRVPDLIEGQTYEFRVKAVNAAGPGEPSSASKPILVKPRKLPPKIDRRNLINVTIKAGQSFSFDVNVKGEPAPDTVWKIKDRIVTERSTLNIQNKPYNTKLICDKSERKDTAIYHIIATNQWGQDEATVEVTVVSKPAKPEGPIEVSDVNKKGCHLKWDKPKDDGGEPIEGYVIEKLEPETGAWVPVARSLIPEADVTGLTPGKSYEFRVKAVNKEGESEPLQTDYPIVAKDPFNTPGQPGRPEPTDWNKDRVDLKWEKPDTDGGAPVTSYIIEKKEKGSPKWVKAAEVPGDQTKGTAPYLEEGKEYEFRVIAVNKAGPGEPSAASKSIVAKPRFLAPYIDRKNLNNITVKAGQAIKFDVDVAGEPPPTIVWHLNDEPLTTSAHMKIDNEEYNTKLSTRNATRADSGKYLITATNSQGKDQASVNVLVVDVPTPPEGPLDISEVNSDTCKLKWKKPKDDGGLPLDGYFVEKLDTDSGVWVPVGKCREPQMEVSGLTPGKQYKFRVSAVNKEGMSEPLEATEAHAMVNKPIIDVDAVRDITVKAGQDFCISVPFTASPKPTASWAYNGKDVDSVDTHFMQKTTDNNAQLVCTNAQRGDTGKFMVTLKNSHGFDTITCNVKVLDRPSPPQNLKTEDNEGESLTLKWSPPKDDGGSDVTNYVVEKREAGSNTWTKVSSYVNGTNLKVKHLTVGRKYDFRVMAENQYGTSDPIQTDEPVLAKYPFDTPDAPGVPKAIDTSDDSVTLKWTKPRNDGGSPITGYVLEKRKVGDKDWTRSHVGTIADLTYKVSGLKNNEEYEFRVAAQNAAGQGAFSYASDAIIARRPPTAPKIDADFTLKDIVVMAGEQFSLRVPFSGSPTPKVEWTANGTVILPDDRVTSEVNESFTILLNRKAKREDSGKYGVKLTNTEGSDSSFCKVLVVDVPGVPQGPLEVSDVTPETCSLTWKPPLDDGGSPITNYIIEKQDQTTKQWIKVSAFVRKCHYEVIGLEPNKVYHFRVSAENQYGVSKPLETDRPITAKFPFNTPDAPGKPTITDSTKNTASLSWERPYSDGGSKIQGYCVEYKEPTDSKWLIGNEFLVKDTNFTIGGLIEGKEYEFRIKAKNAAGWGKPSPPSATFRMKGKGAEPSPPQNLHVKKVGKTYVDLKWEPPRSDGGSKITGYVVERKEHNSSYWIKVNEYGCLDCEYTVLNLTTDNEYDFRVSAVNSSGKSEPCLMSTSVKVQEITGGAKPEFVRKLFNKNTTLKSEMTLECEAIGKPVPTSRWFRNGRELHASGRIRSVDTEEGVFKLIFSEVLDTDEGDYTCEAVNALGTDRCSASVTIAAPPQIIKCPNEVYFPEKDNSKIKIYLSGLSPFDVSLYKDGLEVKESDHLRFTVFDEYLIIFFKDVNKSDEAKYKIMVKNDSGQTDATVQVFVTGLPGKPTGPLDVTDINKNSATISWKPPKYDGGCKITHYIIERKETTHNQWVTATSFCKDTTFTCQGLNEGGEYLFRVMAVNENGQSEPLVGENPIVAKPPYDKPSAPGVPNVTEIGGDFVNLHWEKPQSDGGSRIQGYIVEKRETGSETWQRVNVAYCHSTQINIINLIEDRQYEFRVFAVNDAGLSPSSQNTGSIKIKDPDAATPPEFTIPLKKVIAVENKSTQFTCTVTGVPKPTITWYKGVREIYDGGKYSMIKDGDTYTLTIFEVFGEDADEYACRAVNKGGSRTSRAELVIKTAPKINVPPRFRDMACFERGETIQIKIPFTGNPKPKIKWTKDGEEIEIGDHFDVEVKERHAILTIREVSKLDSGPYTMTAENELGIDSKIINLQISDCPDPPRFPIVEQVGDDFVTLSWKAPLWDGGSTITNYIIEKREPTMDSWVRCGTTRFLMHQITGLNPNRDYEFRVFAENVFGKSGPSEKTQKITTKPSEKDRRRKGWQTDDSGRRIRGKGEMVSNYDQFVSDYEKTVPHAVDIKTSSVYDFYDILEEIGTGAFGVVHRCREKKTGHIFAAKFIPVSHPLEKSIIRKEIDIMNQLHHMKLIRLHDAFEDDDEMVLIYEFMSGGELFERITDEGYKMSESEAQHYVRQIIEGVKHMHEKNIIHLDLKPENIMCQKKSSNQIKIIDFGLATKLNPHEVVKISTGTAEFAAPEIAEREAVGFYTDMWAVGVLTYVLLSGLSPFAGENDIETLKNVKSCDWDFDAEKFKNVSEEAKDFIKKLLTKNKDKRMTAHECLEHQWLKGTDVPTTPIPNRNYIDIRDRMRAKYRSWSSALLPIGHIANYSSLRKLKEEKHKMQEFYFDRREAVPRFVIKPFSTFVYEGQAARFSCRVIASAPPTLSWFRDNNELKQSVKFMKRYEDNDFTFVINRCRLEDRGEYIIRAENHYGFREEPIFLNVLPVPKDIPPVKVDEPVRRRREPTLPLWEEPKDCAPHFTFLLRPRVIQVGFGVKFLCCLNSKPWPEITWYKDGRELNKRDHTISSADGVCTLTITSTKVEDAGKYTCRANNHLGEAETSCNLIVEGKRLVPNHLPAPVTITPPMSRIHTPNPYSSPYSSSDYYGD